VETFLSICGKKNQPTAKNVTPQYIQPFLRKKLNPMEKELCHSKKKNFN
jgi:hypothetical protein